MLPETIISVLSLAAASAASVIPRSNGTCAEPVVRKEWRELTAAEKKDYLRAAVCLRELPKEKYAEVNAVTTRLDDLVWTHSLLTDKIHFVANFLPWHRWYVQLHEDLLRNECGYAGAQPYWDWSIDADAVNVPNSPIFDPDTGFGGDGRLTGSDVPGYGRCVVDGPFANSTLTLGMGWPNVNDDGDRPHCFTRELNNASGNDENGVTIIGDMQASAYNSHVMRTINAFETYSEMQNMLEGLPHAQSSSSLFRDPELSPANRILVHSVLFGDMGPSTSPNEPLFFLHHANVDRAWARVCLLAVYFPRLLRVLTNSQL